MEQYQPKTFLEALRGGLGAAMKVVEPVASKSTERGKGIVHEVWRQKKLEIRSAVTAKAASIYQRRRLRLA